MSWDYEYDAVVVGSGAGGLTAATTAALRGQSALVLEKTDLYGGSSALSGGGVWIPNNLYLEQAGLGDSTDEARKYLDATVGDVVPERRREAYLQQGPRMMRYLHEETRWTRFRWVTGYPDYYPERRGGRPRGRSVEPLLFDGGLLGPELPRLRRANLPTRGIVMSQSEFVRLNMITRTWAAKRTAARVAARAVNAAVRRKTVLSLGEALIARLRMSLAEAGGHLWLNAPMVDLVIEGGRVTGVRVTRRGEEVTVRARHGVVFAAGGFSHSQELREKYLPTPTSTEWTHSSPGQTGDVLRAGITAGAGLDLMDRVWGAPSVAPPGQAPFFLVADRAIPGMVIVDGRGQRYVNEAAPYHEVVDAMYRNPNATTNSWLILDRRSRGRYIFCGLFPGQAFPLSWRDSGFLKEGHTPGDLATEMGIPPETLERTLARFNTDARAAHDSDLGRGESAYDRFYGDPTLTNPNLAPLDSPPYYAVPVVPGDLGTKGGLLTDNNAQVVTESGQPIPGLYATGNCSASVMGHTYPGPGATLGPSMTFGYVAATHMAGRLTPTPQGE